MSNLNEAQIALINKIGYTAVTETELTLTEAETLETLKSRFVRVRKTSKYFNPDGTVFYELSKRGFALYEEMRAAEAISEPAEEETLAAELPAIQDETPTRLVGEVVCKDGVKTQVKVDGTGDLISVSRNEAYRARLGKRIEFQMGKDDVGQIAATDVTDAPPAAVIEKTKWDAQPAPTMHTALIAAKDEHIARLEARVAELEASEARRESRLAKYREFVRDMCGYSFSDRDDSRYVSDCVDELERN